MAIVFVATRGKHQGTGMKATQHTIGATSLRTCLCMLLLTSVSVVLAQEPASFRDDTARKLLEGLEERGMPDVSLWVLDRLEQPEAAISSELRSELAYRKALALVGVGRSEPSIERRQSLFSQAQQAIDAFLASPLPTPKLPAAPDDVDQLAADIQMLDTAARRINAHIQQGKLRQERARLIKSEVAKKQQANAGSVVSIESPEAAAVFAESVASFRAAERLITSSPIAAKAEDGAEPADDSSSESEGEAGETDSLLAQVRKLTERVDAAVEGPRPRAPRGGRSRAEASRLLREWQVSLSERQDDLRNKLLEVRLLLGEGLFEVASSYAAGSDPWQTAIEESIAVDKEMYEKYRTLLAGQFARVSQGRGEAALARAMPLEPDAAPGQSARDKQFTKALGTLADVRALAGGGTIETLRAKAYNISLECWLEMLPSDAYAAFDGIDEQAVRLALSGGGTPESLDSDWLGFKYRTALLLSRIVAAAQPGQGPRNPLLANAGRSIQKLAMTVAKANRDFSAEARELLAGNADVGLVEDFATLMDRAALAVDTMKTKQALAKQLASQGDADGAATATGEATTARDEAIALMRQALPIAEAEELAAVNRGRYTLTFLLYDGGRLLDAAAMGEFLATWYPNAPGSLQAARIAMASWQKLSTTSEMAMAAEAKRRCGLMAEQILSRWPDDPASKDAAAIAISAVAAEGDPSRIFEVVAKIPEHLRDSGTSARGGIAAWKAIAGVESAKAADGPSAESIASWKHTAATLLDQGLAGSAEGGAVGMLTVAAALARCQIAVNLGDLPTATAVLEHPSYGPWTVVTSGNDPAGAAGSMAEDILQVALPLFIQTEQIAKAETAMTKLEAVATDPARLTATYLRLGRELQTQLEQVASTAVDGRLDADGRKRASAILDGFERFLEAVSSRSSEVQSRLWVATTYLELGSASLGDGAAQGMGVVVPRAKADACIAKAAAIYESLLTETDEQTKRFEPSIRFKLAELYRVIGKFDDALENIAWILADSARVNWIDGQFEAARILQAAGEAAADVTTANKRLTEAIVGGSQGGAKFWGWGGLANRLSRQAVPPENADADAQQSSRQFFEARLELARCRKAIATKVPAGREDALSKAERDITVTYRLYPGLGGSEMRAEFDALMKQIQQDLGEPAVGLAAIEGVAAPAGS